MFTKSLSLANKLAVAGKAYQPSKSERRAFALLSALALTNRAAFAQGAQAALEGVQETVLGIVQVVFAIGLIVFLVVVVLKFMRGAPDALGSLGWLVGAVILWFGFQLFKDDLVGAVGGGQGGVR